MLNKELLLCVGKVGASPRVITPIDYTSDNSFTCCGYNEGTYRPGAVNRKPYWTKGSGNKLTSNLLVDYTDNKPSFYSTGLNFENGPLLP